MLLLLLLQVLDDTKGPITRKEYELMQVRGSGSSSSSSKQQQREDIKQGNTSMQTCSSSHSSHSSSCRCNATA
jgi:hypothetical protein